MALWGLAGATVPVAWQAWIARTVPDEAEVGGGLLVAAIQLAMAVGAAAGGLVFDATGPVVVFATNSAVMLVGAIVILAGLRTRTLHSARGAEVSSGGSLRATSGAGVAPANLGAPRAGVVQGELGAGQTVADRPMTRRKNRQRSRKACSGWK